MKLRIVIAFLLLPLLAMAQGQASSPASGIDAAAMNKSVDPCVDFYQYACGNWIAKNPLPADRSRWGRFGELQDHNENVELGLLESAAVVKPGRDSLDQKIGDYFASCMDTATINKKGIAPLKGELDRIQAMNDEPDVVAEIGHLHRLGVGVLFGFSAAPDAKDSNRTIATLRQGGLSLPDREYYLKTDAKSVEIRQRFEQHMKNMFQLAGGPADTAASKARMVLDMETTLAKVSMDRVSMRDPDKTYHIVTRQQLAALSAGFDWNSYLKGVGAPAFETLNIAQPDFLKQIAATLPSQPLTAFQAYFSYHLLRAAASELPEAFENENFDFWQRYLSGVKEPRPRANRCAAVVDRSLGDLLGQKYIEKAFGADAKAQITQLVEALDKALESDIQTLPWMTDATKKAAIVKLHAITNNVGYPKKWRDYSKVSVVRDDFLGNGLRVSEAM